LLEWGSCKPSSIKTTSEGGETQSRCSNVSWSRLSKYLSTSRAYNEHVIGCMATRIGRVAKTLMVEVLKLEWTMKGAHYMRFL